MASKVQSPTFKMVIVAVVTIGVVPLVVVVIVQTSVVSDVSVTCKLDGEAEVVTVNAELP